MCVQYLAHVGCLLIKPKEIVVIILFTATIDFYGELFNVIILESKIVLTKDFVLLRGQIYAGEDHLKK